MNDETKLITQILAGDTAKYAALVERYQKGLILHCFQMVRDYSLAEDIAQEAFVAAFTQLPSYNQKYRFSTWLYKIATNKAIDFLRRNKMLSDGELPEVTSPQDVHQDALNEEVRRAVLSLPLQYRSVVTLYYWQGKNYEEIAGIMGKPVGTIRTWLRRAKMILREELS